MRISNSARLLPPFAKILRKNLLNWSSLLLLLGEKKSLGETVCNAVWINGNKISESHKCVIQLQVSKRTSTVNISRVALLSTEGVVELIQRPK